VDIYLNGELTEFPSSLSLQELIETLKLGPERIAVELNGLVVPRSEWAARVLGDGDRIEIVHFVGGGNGFCLA
jgi:thiamine biosynthesis protein ThiS